jgi:hypothetical protein
MGLVYKLLLGFYSIINSMNPSNPLNKVLPLCRAEVLPFKSFNCKTAAQQHRSTFLE